MRCQPQNILVAIMSFNRGVYLENCVGSVEQFLPGARVAIFDDGSNDRRTKKALRSIRRSHDVLVSSSGGGAGHLGGLHANMRCAIDHAISLGLEYVLFVQEDLQLVRPCDRAVFEQIEIIFEGDLSIAQVMPTFFKGFLPNSALQERYRVRGDLACYEDSMAGMADIGFVSIERLKKAGFAFGCSETENGQRAKALGLRSVVMANPLMMYTPWPRTSRRRRPLGTILARLNEIGVGAGLHPYLRMEQADIERLYSRSIDDFPVAEDYLRTRRHLRVPWWYTNCAEMQKIKNWRYFYTLAWLRNGPVEYMDYVKSRRKSEV